MVFLPKIAVVDDAGNEFFEITVPIPFYIRIQLEEGMTRYRVRLIDDFGKIRGQYSGSTQRSFLELHIPPIKLPRPGKLRILVEESSGEPQYSHQYQGSILYLDYTQEKGLIAEETGEVAASNDPSNSLTIPTDLQKEKSLSSSDLEVNDSHSLTDEETKSLFQREESFNETLSADLQHLTEEEE